MQLSYRKDIFQAQLHSSIFIISASLHRLTALSARPLSSFTNLGTRSTSLRVFHTQWQSCIAIHSEPASPKRHSGFSHLFKKSSLFCSRWFEIRALFLFITLVFHSPGPFLCGATKSDRAVAVSILANSVSSYQLTELLA